MESNDNIYHDGNISKMPNFDVFSLLDIKNHKRRSHGKRKNGNFKQKHKTILSFSELNIHFLLFEIRKIAVCFLWLSLPGHYRVTDEALLAETK